MNCKRAIRVVLLGALLGVTSVTPAYADAVWPALLLAVGLLSWGPILTGLLLEYLVVRTITGFEWKKSLKADLLMNAASALVGSIAISLAGILLEVGDLGAIDTEESVAFSLKIGVLVLGAAYINCRIEAYVLLRVFHVTLDRVRFLWLYSANLITTAVATIYIIFRLLGTGNF